MPKCCIFPSDLNIKMATQKFTNFGKFFKMHSDIVAVTIQSIKTVLNEIKDN